MIDTIKKVLAGYGGSWKEKNGVWEFSFLVAERKTFLSKKKLTYSATMKIDKGAKLVKFSEFLMEAGSGLSSGGGIDGGMSPGFGFKAESYNTLTGARKGTIKEQSDLFGKKYDYTFDYKEIRSKVEKAVKSSGYTFAYQILPVT